MENSNNSNCCAPDHNANTSCCPPTTNSSTENKGGLKKGVGMLLLGLAFIFAISAAFKNASSGEANGYPLSIDDFEWMKTDNDVAYVFLEGDEKEQNQIISAQISEVIFELNDSDGSVGQYELSSSHEHFASFMEKAGVENLPAVVVLGKKANLSHLSSESISPIKLLRAYVVATSPAASCKPSASCKPASGKTCTPAQRAKCNAKKSN